MTTPAPLTTFGWCHATGGSLTRDQRRLLQRHLLLAYGPHVAGLLRLATGRRSNAPLALPPAVDPALFDAALTACRSQGPDLEGHGLRTWLFGAVLAASDGATVDHDLLCVAAIAHDVGLAQPVPGEDFTIRSAQAAVASFERAGRALSPDRAVIVQDAIVAHATPGLTAEDSLLGHYLQAGATLDLTGLRLADLPRRLVQEVFERHPAGTIRATLPRLIAAEAAAVPEGRFALIRRLGFSVAVRSSPTLR